MWAFSSNFLREIIPYNSLRRFNNLRWTLKEQAVRSSHTCKFDDLFSQYISQQVFTCHLLRSLAVTKWVSSTPAAHSCSLWKYPIVVRNWRAGHFEYLSYFLCYYCTSETRSYTNYPINTSQWPFSFPVASVHPSAALRLWAPRVVPLSSQSILASAYASEITCTSSRSEFHWCFEQFTKDLSARVGPSWRASTPPSSAWSWFCRRRWARLWALLFCFSTGWQSFQRRARSRASPTSTPWRFYTTADCRKKAADCWHPCARHLNFLYQQTLFNDLYFRSSS